MSVLWVSCDPPGRCCAKIGSVVESPHTACNDRMREDKVKIGRGALGEEEDHDHWQREHGGDCHQ